MFSSLKSQVNTWITSNKDDSTNSSEQAGDKKSKTYLKFGEYLPKILKSETTDANSDPKIEMVKPVAVDDPKRDSAQDDESSSSTEGADSKPPSLNDSPTNEENPLTDTVSKKALAGAKSFGTFLFSSVNKAGKTVSEAGAKIRKTVEENPILAEFNREQMSFVKDQKSKLSTDVILPWVGCENEEEIKQECLGLSMDKRNFVKSPPMGIDLQFDYDKYYPLALALMTEDPKLEKMRFELVPKIVSEENFWRNYFYRVNLICQANDTGRLGYQQNLESDSDGQKQDEEQDVEKNRRFSYAGNTENEFQDYEVIATGAENQTVEKDN